MADEFLDVEVDALRELVRWQGTRLDWYKARLCPCRLAQSSESESTREGDCEFDCMDGWIYIKQEVPASIADSLGVITNYNKSVYNPEFGRVPSGQANWISMVDECELSDHDIIVHSTAPELTKQLVRRRSNSDSDELAHPCVESVVEVSRGFSTWNEGEHFELVIDESHTFPRAALRWFDVAQAPPPNSFYSVDYMRYPRLMWLDEGNRPARRNHAGQRLVQRGTLLIISLSKDNK